MNNTLDLDISPQTVATVQQTLLTLVQGPDYNVVLKASDLPNYVLNGIRTQGKFRVVGDLGDYCAMSFGDAEGYIDGSAGNYFGHSLQSGMLTVRGNTKNSLAALGVGGLLTVYGSSGSRTAVGLQGADVVVRGSVASLAGLGMRAGTLIIGGNAGEELGKGMTGGTIYLRGEPASLSDDIEEVRIKESDKLKIGLLLLKAGIKAAGKDFKVFRSVH